MTFNPLYLLLILPALLGFYTQQQVRVIYKKYGANPNRRGVSGLEAAQYLLAQHHLTGVRLEGTPGYLTDHYDPQSKILRLSEGIANDRSVTSLGVVAHEVGHAMQDAEGYGFMRVRTFLAHRVGQMTQWSSLIFIGGMLFGSPSLMVLGGVMLAGLVLFALMSLPVERNASDRALASLRQTGLAEAGELEGARQALQAAACTYLAALGQRLGSFLFFVIVVTAALGVWQR